MQQELGNTFEPDPRAREEMEGFINHVCVGTTGRLGIVTHVEASNGSWRCAGFGLDGKGVWTSTKPTIIADAEGFYNKVNARFNGAFTFFDTPVVSNVEDMAQRIGNIEVSLQSPAIDTQQIVETIREELRRQTANA